MVRPLRQADGVSQRRPATAMGSTIRELREERGLDQTLQNLLRALTLNLELRARYRVFEFEATQDGHPDAALLFRELRELEATQITALLSGLHERLGTMDLE